ncbi:MAG: 2-oxo-4-hydroxy-4-carboxy-5-ureidoimidazoline decarboxylase [Acidobacteria bacterium]|nr:2-oxo-4-hydroxy-4-carboxy-5-ureidoimidazoline decarboxylase [Acidobacteriota bacterium]MBP7475780.1 2-oxo-4-hydroxy-4-carboxy-5-ureidoimidazoline decarboxylase [Pyrinomonadaceae bacterium]
MSNPNVYKRLAEINEMPSHDAEALFLTCCGSKVWATAMTLARPFPLIEPLFVTANSLWSALSNADRLEAYSGEGRLGDLASSDEEMISELAEAFRLYRDKFGFIFIVNTGGRSAIEVLAICRARLGNSVETELVIAAEEQRKTIESRLRQLLEK